MADTWIKGCFTGKSLFPNWFTTWFENNFGCGSPVESDHYLALSMFIEDQRITEIGKDPKRPPAEHLAEARLVVRSDQVWDETSRLKQCFAQSDLENLQGQKTSLGNLLHCLLSSEQNDFSDIYSDSLSDASL